MEENESTAPVETPKVRLEHVALSVATTEKINRWHEQIMAKKKIKLSRKDLVNMFIENSPDNLSTGFINSVIERFYDLEAYLRQLVREVKKAKANGQAEGELEVVVRARKMEVKKEAMETEQVDQVRSN